MSTRYTASQRNYAIECLRINDGDVALTSMLTGIPIRTLARWKTEDAALLTPPMPQPRMPPQPPQMPQPASLLTLSADDVIAWRELQGDMMGKVKLLNNSIDDAIPEASLGQRILGLIHLMDRIMKMSAQLPRLEAVEEVEIAVAHHVEKTEDLEEEDGEKAVHPIA